MSAVLAEVAGIATIVFAVSSMLSVGLAYSVGAIIEPLRASLLWHPPALTMSRRLDRH